MNRKTLIGSCSTLALFVAVMFTWACSGCSSKPVDSAVLAKQEQAEQAAKEKADQIKRDVADAETRINTCAQRVNVGDKVNKNIADARNALKEYAADPEKKPMYSVDRELHAAYVAAKRPEVIADLHQAIAEQNAYLSHVADSANTSFCWQHLRQAEVFLEQYAGDRGHHALPILIRQECAYVQQVMEQGATKAPTKLIGALDQLLELEKVGNEPRPNLRLYAHTKQARRFYDAFIKTSASRKDLLTLAVAECMYASKVHVEPGYVIGSVVERNTEPVVCGNGSLPAKEFELAAPYLQLVDSLVSKIEIVDESFPGNEKAHAALAKVRKTYDWVLSDMTNGHSYRDQYFVIDSLRDVDLVIEKLREEAGPFKLAAPFQADFQGWLDKYLEDNDSSWLRGQNCEFWLVPQAHVGTASTARLIAGREHCYLNMTFKQSSVLAVTKATK